MALFIILLVLVLIAAIVSLPGVLVVKIGTRLMGRFTTSFHTAYTAVVSSYLYYFAIQVVLTMFLRIQPHVAVMLGIMYLLHAWFYFRRVRGDNGQVLSIPASLLLALFQVLITGFIIAMRLHLPCGISFPSESK